LTRTREREGLVLILPSHFAQGRPPTAKPAPSSLVCPPSCPPTSTASLLRAAIMAATSRAASSLPRPTSSAITAINPVTSSPSVRTQLEEARGGKQILYKAKLRVCWRAGPLRDASSLAWSPLSRLPKVTRPLSSPVPYSSVSPSPSSSISTPTPVFPSPTKRKPAKATRELRVRKENEGKMRVKNR
ncbi:hypothetical protein PFISCL1PPCAC_18758, partial [Pristionchus fissidentatus]